MSPHTDFGAPARWRSSLRRLLRGRAPALAAVAALAAFPALAGGATGGSGPDSQAQPQSHKSQHKSSVKTLRPGSTGRSVKRLQRRLHVRATGYYGKLTKRAVKRFQRHHGLKADGIAGPKTLRKLGMTVKSASSSRPRLPAVLKKIAQCESGGNPRAVSPDGRYRGKYQFDQSTWEAWGGNGDPAKARERTQDRVALRLYKARGTAPWPNCA
jgi:peptidoglycan hydrolase-like protein with peptidoglycan-binding domain